MSGQDSPKIPTQEQIDDAFNRAKAHPHIMGQAMGMANMAYAFQFAQHATPKSDIVPLENINERLHKLSEEKAVVFSTSVFVHPKKGTLDVLVSYYSLGK